MTVGTISVVHATLCWWLVVNTVVSVAWVQRLQGTLCVLCVGTEDCEEGIVYIASYIWLNMVVSYYSKQHVAGTLSLKCWYPSTKEHCLTSWKRENFMVRPYFRNS